MPHHVLVIKPSSLGDIVHTLPAVSAVRQHFAEAHITWLVKKQWAPILAGNPDIDAALAVDFSLPAWPGLFRRLRNLRIDLALDFQGLFRSGAIAWLSGASRRVGFARAREGAPMFYTDKVSLPELGDAVWRLGTVHAIDRNLALAAYAGADVSKYQWHLPDFSEDRSVVQGLLRDHGVKGEEAMVAVAPWSRSALKCWPLDRFVELVGRLVERQGIRPVLLGGRDDAGQAAAFSKWERRGMINMVGKVALRQVPVLLRQMKGFVGNDSALLHMAAGLSIPVVGLYGPTSHLATGPYPLDRHVTIRRVLPCSPCGKLTCGHTVYQECLKSIDVNDVLTRLKFLWDNSCEAYGGRARSNGDRNCSFGAG